MRQSVSEKAERSRTKVKVAYTFSAASDIVCYLCNWAISWLMSSNSFMPVNSPEPTELELSCKERNRNRERAGEEGRKTKSKQVGKANFICWRKWNDEMEATEPPQTGAKEVGRGKERAGEKPVLHKRSRTEVESGLGQSPTCGCHHHWQTAEKRKDSGFCNFMNNIFENIQKVFMNVSFYRMN